MESSVSISDTLVRVTKQGAKIDLSAMGEGYAIEGIHQVLSKARVENYMIEIGGEIFAHGENAQGNTWTIGIEDASKARSNSYENIVTKIQLNDIRTSTSCNYRKVYTDQTGHNHPHIITHTTASPVQHHMASASAKGPSPLLADLYAPACMAMPTENAQAFITADSDVQAFIAHYE